MPARQGQHASSHETQKCALTSEDTTADASSGTVGGGGGASEVPLFFLFLPCRISSPQPLASTAFTDAFRALFPSGASPTLGPAR